MRDAAARLMGGDRIGRDVFLRGSPEGLAIVRKTNWHSDQFSLIEAYGRVKARTAPAVHMVRERPVMTLDSALDRVSAMLGVTLEWMELRDFLPPHAEPRLRTLRARIQLRRCAGTGSAGQGGNRAGRDIRPPAAEAQRVNRRSTGR